METVQHEDGAAKDVDGAQDGGVMAWRNAGQSRRRRQPYDFIHPDGLHPWRGDESAHGTEPVGPLFRSCKGSRVPLQSVGS